MAIGRKENEVAYLVYYNIFIDVHHHCLGGDVMCKYIGRYLIRKVGRWVGGWAYR
jgi:hypothetical protein